MKEKKGIDVKKYEELNKRYCSETLKNQKCVQLYEHVEKKFEACKKSNNCKEIRSFLCPIFKTSSGCLKRVLKKLSNNQ